MSALEVSPFHGTAPYNLTFNYLLTLFMKLLTVIRDAAPLVCMQGHYRRYMNAVLSYLILRRRITTNETSFVGKVRML